MRETKIQELVDMFTNASEEELDQMGALLIAIREGTVEEKALLRNPVNCAEGNESIQGIINKYISTAQYRFEHGLSLIAAV